METHYKRMEIQRDHLLNPIESIIYNIASNTSLRSKEDIIDKYMDYINKNKNECKIYTTNKFDVINAIKHLVNFGYLKEIPGHALIKAISNYR